MKLPNIREGTDGTKVAIEYKSHISDITNVNSSFDKGILRVCYHGRNRNRSSIRKSVIEKCIKTIYNVPIVCNYIREEDEIGAHDVEIIKTERGTEIVNITTPVGVVPTGANYWWEKIDDNGTEHEYLCVEVLLWKRQEAYRKIKEDGIVAESMEITVKNGKTVDGYYEVYDFEFTALCLLGKANPCFESAALVTFAQSDFWSNYSLMMDDLKQEFKKVQSAYAVDILHPHKNYTEGGTEALMEEKLAILAKYNVDIDSIDFDVESISIDELEAKFADDDPADDNGDNGGDPNDGEGGDTTGNEDGGTEDGDDDPKDDDQTDPQPTPEPPTPEPPEPTPQEPEPPQPAPQDEDDDESPKPKSPKYSLTSEQMRTEICDALSIVTVSEEWGDCPRYLYIDFDFNASEVYVYDRTDNWRIYGFKYILDGDALTIDFDSKTRKKIVFADYIDGDPDMTFDQIGQEISSLGNASVKYKEQVDSLTGQISELQEFKEQVQRVQIENVLNSFEDLQGNEDFELLKSNASKYSIEDLEEKCYALRGRYSTTTKTLDFAVKTPKLMVTNREQTGESNEPYGGIFIKFKSN